MTASLVRLTLRPIAGDVPAMVQLRGLLKRLGRSYGFTCTRIEEIPVEPKAPTIAAPARRRRPAAPKSTRKAPGRAAK